jgi:1,4-alpha-glucan branching enzyme
MTSLTSEPLSSHHVPAYLTHVKQGTDPGKIDISVKVYLPTIDFPKTNFPKTSEAKFAPEAKGATEQLAVQVKVGSGDWQDLNPPEDRRSIGDHRGQPCWSLDLTQLSEGTPLLFRYKGKNGNWEPITPLNDLENIYDVIYVPAIHYQWSHQPPPYNHAKVLMETTLEGLLAGYKGGKFAPKDLDELLNSSIAQRILKTDIPGQLSQWNIDEIMVPVCASVANRACLDPKFNYLTYNFVEVDWQIGNTYDFQHLVDKFYEYGIQLVPDLIFAHQVRDPFRGKGSMDRQVNPLDGKPIFVDVDAFLFRDYGTWMLNLASPNIRKMLIEKIVGFIQKFRLKIIRIDYIDGLILQYSNRPENYAEQFVRELKAALKAQCPEVVALGETFEVAGNPAVRNFIDVFYAPIGFSIVEELYKPPARMNRPLFPDVNALAGHIEQVLRSDRREAYYAQLHDETWYCPHIVQGRPYVPWAYGGHPAQLAKHQGEELVQMGLLQRRDLLDFVRRTVRNAEALTMFLANLRYMFVPSVDALSLGCLDDPNQWKVTWEGIVPEHLQEWQKTGLSNREIVDLHRQHRADMVKLRDIFRKHTKVDEKTYQPLVQPQVNHFDQDASLLSLFRPNQHHPQDCLLIIFNFGSQAFHQELPYELPVPEGFEGAWEVLFDGDRATHPSLLKTTAGQYSNRADVLMLGIGARSLVVLRYQVVGNV